MRRRRSRGQGLAEFALALPIFVLLLLGLFDVGRLVFAYTTITNSAREGARLASVNQALASVEKRVEEQTAVADPTTTVEFHETTPNEDAADNPTCFPLKQGCIALVRVETTLSVITPVIGALIGPLDLTAELQVPIAFVCPSSIAGFTDPDGLDCPKQP